MVKSDIIKFFDSLADSWDDNTVKVRSKINMILDIAEITKDKRVLDVACGTGVLIPDYLERNISECLAVDISEKMIEKAKIKFGNNPKIQFLCADAESIELNDKFDCIMIYNAFPHFTDAHKLFGSLRKLLSENGRITVAHSMSRQALIEHHSGNAKKVSAILPEAEEMAEIMKPYFIADVKISTEEIYIVSGKNNNL